ncbi:MAG: hypothetical protein KDC98_02950 [Planctomycetes bacterium]|nr:hypothetical protein [Planctomycetota bacterium]
MRRSAIPMSLLAGVLAGCSSLSYDLSRVPFAVSASPAAPGVSTEPFELRGKSVLWVHGLFGADQPDVAALLCEACGDCGGVADFRVEVGASGHDWLLTHLTLGLVRLKTVTIRGARLEKPRP